MSGSIRRRATCLCHCLPGLLTMVVSAAVFLASAVRAAEPNPEWPQVRLPEGVATFPIGERMTVGGMPMHIIGFVSEKPPAVLLPALRQSLGQPLVENRSGDRHLLGRAEGRFYLTVQLTASADGSRGIVSIADREANDGQASAASPASRWLDRLPSGSTLSSDVAAVDAGKVARHLVFLNGHAESVNRDALMRLMQADGFRLDQETRADAASRGQLPARLAEATALHFSAPSRQASAVIVRDNGRTALIVNTVTELQDAR